MLSKAIDLDISFSLAVCTCLKVKYIHIYITHKCLGGQRAGGYEITVSVFHGGRRWRPTAGV